MVKLSSRQVIYFLSAVQNENENENLIGQSNVGQKWRSLTKNYVRRKCYPRKLVSSDCFTGQKWRYLSDKYFFPMKILSDIILYDEVYFYVFHP